MWLAYAASMIETKDFDEAEQVLDELDRLRAAMPDGDEASAEICSYLRGVLHFTTQRWPDVLSALSNSGSFTDEYIAAGAHLMVGSACAQMGLFGEGIRRLDQAIEGPIPAARRAAEFCKGLTLREMGNEQEARVIFERIYSEEPGFEANSAALRDPKYRLIITSKEMIDSRTDRWDPASAPSAEDLLGDDLSERGNEYLRAAQQELDRQIGLSEVKLQVAKLKSAAMLAKVRGDKGLNSASRSLHLAFTGPPGTGKTTIARVVAQTYCGLGLLRTPAIVEAKRHDFVGQHLGSTAIKTTALIDSAMDGVLFIDEAYTLIQTGLSGGDAFGREAVDTLLARMENDRDRLVVIIAGYDAEIDRFLASNEGLASRFSKRIRFPSYNALELGDIGRLVATVARLRPVGCRLRGVGVGVHGAVPRRGAGLLGPRAPQRRPCRQRQVCTQRHRGRGRRTRIPAQREPRRQPARARRSPVDAHRTSRHAGGAQAGARHGHPDLTQERT